MSRRWRRRAATWWSINRNGKLVIVDQKGRERERYALAYGSHLHVHEGQEVEPGADLVEWDPFTSSILTEIAGKIEFRDIVEGENVREETDKVTGLSQRIIVEASANEKRIPALVVQGKAGERRYILPSGSHLMVQDGDSRSLPATCWSRSRAPDDQDQGHHRWPAARRRAVRGAVRRRSQRSSPRSTAWFASARSTRACGR